MDREFEGKVVIVTGAASGLGRATARAFAAAGAILVLADVDAGGLEEICAELRGTGGKVLGVPTDISDAAACLALAPLTVEEFGQLDAVCNVAGAFRFDHATEITPEVWDRIHGSSSFRARCRT
jgi:NAD(P)-dependent dehydrogenase (short-subunit alcohol dehydrogenase family)